MNGHKRAWFVGKNLFEQFPQLGDEWREIVRTVADTRETYIDRRGFRGASHLPSKKVRTGIGTCSSSPSSCTTTATARC